MLIIEKTRFKLHRSQRENTRIHL